MKIDLPTKTLYAIDAPEVRRVKIGLAENVWARLHHLRTISPATLELIWQSQGSYGVERHMHELLHTHRHHGEWFTYDGDPLLMIEEAYRVAMKTQSVWQAAHLETPLHDYGAAEVRQASG